jgi:hypothetical protein
MMPNAATPRLVLPEMLDELAAEDPRAQRARRDLRRVHGFMRSPAILKRLIETVALPRTRPCRLIELGAGDGTLMLRVAARLGALPSRVELTLLDRVDLLADSTREAYRQMGWEARTLIGDVRDWARVPDEAAGPGAAYDLCIAALFLHHFPGAELAQILRGIARRASALVCIEPRRSIVARIGARCIGVIGVNAVTRGDALTSVLAGFHGQELSQAWTAPDWELEEFPALPFTQCFTARRRSSEVPTTHVLPG